MQFKYLKTIMLFTILASSACIINNNSSIASQASQDTKKPSVFRNLLSKFRGKSGDNSTNNDLNYLKTKKEELLSAVNNILRGQINSKEDSFIDNEATSSINSYITNINKTIRKLRIKYQSKTNGVTLPQDRSRLDYLGYCIIPVLPLTARNKPIADKSTMEHLKDHLENKSCSNFDPLEPLRINIYNLRYLDHLERVHLLRHGPKDVEKAYANRPDYSRVQ